MEKISKLRQVIREELMKELGVGSMARGGASGGSGPLFDAILKTYKLNEKEFGRPEFDEKNKVIFFPDGQHDGLFATWTKPNGDIKVNGELLDVDEWDEEESRAPSSGGRKFYIMNIG